LGNCVAYRNPNAKKRDIQSVRSIYALRANHPAPSVEKSEAVLVTSNAGFANAAWEYGQGHESTRNVSSVVTDFSLANMAWLKAPVGSLNIPETQLLAFAYAALQPSATMLDQYMREIDKLQDRGEITERDHQLLRSDPRAYDELVHLTLGEDASLTEQTVSQVLKSVTSEIEKEASTRLSVEKGQHEKTRNALRAQEKLTRILVEKIYWRCRRKSYMMSGSASITVLVFLVIGLFFGQMSDNSGVESKIISISSLVVLLLTFANLVVGSSIRSVFFSVQNMSLVWLLKRECRSSGVESNILNEFVDL